MENSTLDQIIAKGVKLTPMMQQYAAIKNKHREHLLLFRMGDFYEVFFEDAISTSKILNIALTHRGKLGDTPIPMAGIPHHAAPTYIDRITSAGLKVAICEQIGDPKAKGIVKREVTQICSPGIPFDLDKTGAKENNYIISTLFSEGKFLLIAFDFTNGDFFGQSFDFKEQFLDAVRLLAPKELITYMGQWDSLPEFKEWSDHHSLLKTHLSMEYFENENTHVYLEKLIPGFKRDRTLNENPEVLSPIGALAYYLCSTGQAEHYFHIRPFKMHNDSESLKVSSYTLQGLEILPKSRDSYKDSLLGYLDCCRSSMGSRTLKKLIIKPFYHLEKIKQRQSLVEYLFKNSDSLFVIRESMDELRDLERILSKVSTRKANSSDLLAISSAMAIFHDLHEEIEKLPKHTLPQIEKKDEKELTTLKELLQGAVNDEIGVTLEKGNFFNKGFNKKRDKLARLSTNVDEELIKLETKYREETGIQKLRIKNNNVAGFFIEVSKAQSDAVPKYFDRRQTLVNSERYTTEELTQFEKEIISAKDKLLALDRELYQELLDQINEKAKLIQKLALFFGTLDAVAALSWVSFRENFVKPSMTTKKQVELKGAWHPMIKSNIAGKFIHHDLLLGEKVYFGLITGPNMSGKTTVMREVAIIQVLAQMGCFVPAEKAKLGLCDQLFSRLGASDDILKGQSTFMVEMSETAEIIRHATERSMIILDEVGRGTSTYDGLSIAWALVEYLVAQTKAIGLFATHYHELIDLATELTAAKNLTVETSGSKDNVQFLYRLVEKGASQSFGIYVAKLAGLPPTLLHRANSILDNLETQQSKPIVEEQLVIPGFLEEEVPKTNSLFSEKIEREMKELNIYELTPLEVMNWLSEKQSELRKQH
jgi:DNA mismatch repair protein MutS